MDERERQRLKDIVDAINQIESLLENVGLADVISNRHLRAAFERYVEVLSEASRSIPDRVKLDHPEIQWKNIANIGNHIRHAYNRIDPEVLWNTYQSGELAELKSACLRYLSRNG